jgi:alpha-D-ribose 1-methylphosphonate 5-triphosphate synthase subunit PhnG
MPIIMQQFRPAKRVLAVRITPANLEELVDLVRLHEGGDNVRAAAGGFAILRGYRTAAGDWEPFNVGEWLVNKGSEEWPEYHKLTDAMLQAAYESVEGTL